MGNSSTGSPTTLLLLLAAELRSIRQHGNKISAVHIVLFCHTCDDVRGEKTVFIVCSYLFVVVRSQTDMAVSPTKDYSFKRLYVSF